MHGNHRHTSHTQQLKNSEAFSTTKKTLPQRSTLQQRANAMAHTSKDNLFKSGGS